MTEQTVLVEVRNRVGHLTLNRPAGLNALNLDMVRQLRQQLDAWLNDDQVRVVVLLQLAQPVMQTLEWPFMCRQHQHRIGQIAEAPQ